MSGDKIKTIGDLEKDVKVAITYWENEIKLCPNDEEITIQARAKLLVLHDVLERIGELKESVGKQYDRFEEARTERMKMHDREGHAVYLALLEELRRILDGEG